MSIYDNINAGKYKVQIPYPDRAVKPKQLSANVAHLTDGEIKALPKLRAEYEAACQKFGEELDKWREEDNRLRGVFYEDLLAEHGIPKDDELASLLLGKAWEDGHSGGYSDVASVFHDLVSIYEFVQKNYTKKKSK